MSSFTFQGNMATGTKTAEFTHISSAFTLSTQGPWALAMHKPPESPKIPGKEVVRNSFSEFPQLGPKVEGVSISSLKEDVQEYLEGGS